MATLLLAGAGDRAGSGFGSIIFSIELRIAHAIYEKVKLARTSLSAEIPVIKCRDATLSCMFILAFQSACLPTADSSDRPRSTQNILPVVTVKLRVGKAKGSFESTFHPASNKETHWHLFHSFMLFKKLLYKPSINPGSE